jgi:hypothetical protein
VAHRLRLTVDRFNGRAMRSNTTKSCSTAAIVTLVAVIFACPRRAAAEVILVPEPVTTDQSDNEDAPPVRGPLSAQFAHKALPRLRAIIKPACGLTLDLRLDEKGKVASVEVLLEENPTADEQRRLSYLLLKLTANDASAADDAAREIEKFGAVAAMTVQSAAAKEKQPEIKQRLTLLTAALEKQTAATKKQIETAKAFLRGLVFDGEDVRGERFLLSVTRGEFEGRAERREQSVEVEEGQNFIIEGL